MAELGDAVLLLNDFFGDFEFELGGEVATGLWHVRCPWGGGLFHLLGCSKRLDHDTDTGGVLCANLARMVGEKISFIAPV